MSEIYLHNFENQTDVENAFEIEPLPENVNILIASYTYEDYSGDAFVLFEQDGKLYEVHGGHCSCYGLEGQWGPEEATHADINYRIEKGYLGISEYSANEFRSELIKVLEGLS